MRINYNFNKILVLYLAWSSLIGIIAFFFMIPDRSPMMLFFFLPAALILTVFALISSYMALHMFTFDVVEDGLIFHRAFFNENRLVKWDQLKKISHPFGLYYLFTGPNWYHRNVVFSKLFMKEPAKFIEMIDRYAPAGSKIRKLI